MLRSIYSIKWIILNHKSQEIDQLVECEENDRL